MELDRRARSAADEVLVAEMSAAGLDMPAAFSAGACAASSVLGTRHLHPMLDRVLGRSAP